MAYIILGNGVAGTEAARNIRKIDPSAEIMIFTQDHYPLYFRPRIPDLLAKEVTAEQIFVYKTEWYYKNKIQLYLNCIVKSIDQKNQTIVLTDGSHFSYSKLLLATGSTGFVPSIDGINTTRDIFTLQTIEDGRITGAIFLGDIKNAYEIGKLMEKKADVSSYKEKILESDFDIKNLLK
ncbi:MAG: FAD-dependent oxidoreductase [Candidatus Brocadia sp.]|nr:FAD-dependent oxidoreductase [Candidatus Brocadia sp.]NUO08268.1 FAD-dependent oxidoreductase [Candidatus Brocadia sp.]